MNNTLATPLFHKSLSTLAQFWQNFLQVTLFAVVNVAFLQFIQFAAIYFSNFMHFFKI